MSTSKGLIWQRKYKVLSLLKIQQKTVGTQGFWRPKCRHWNLWKGKNEITHTGGFNLSCSVYVLTAFHLSFLPAVQLRAWLSILETPAVLPRSRSRRGCQGGCTGQWIRWRAVECRNCSRVSFCGPSFLFPLRFNMKFSRCRCANGMWRMAWLLPWWTENADTCQAKAICVSAFSILLCHDYIRTGMACQENLERRHIEAKNNRRTNDFFGQNPGGNDWIFLCPKWGCYCSTGVTLSVSKSELSPYAITNITSYLTNK